MPPAPARTEGGLSHRFARERDRSGRHEFERGEQVRGFATYQGEKLGERGARRELQPGGRAADRQGREAQHSARDDAESSLASNEALFDVVACIILP